MTGAPTAPPEGFPPLRRSDEAFMPVALVAFGALIGLTSVGLS